jgi:hypothetical protein
MRTLREFYENIAFTSTKDENAIGPLRVTADSILEQLQNEECSLAHHVRALSMLLWLAEILEKIGISLDRQTRDEVEGCAKALTGEYLRRRRYNEVDVLWALEWASKRTIEEMAPQVPDSIFENIEGLDVLADLGGLAGLAGLGRLMGLMGLAGLGRLMGLEGLAGVARLEGIEGLTRLEGLDRLQRLTRLEGLARLARLARLERLLQGLQGLQDFQVLQVLQGLDGLQGLQVLQGLEGFEGLQVLQGPEGLEGLPGLLRDTTTHMDIPRCANIARLALGDTPESKH